MKNKIFSKNLGLFAKRFFLIFIFYQFIRVGFFSYNQAILDPFSWDNFIGGVRFDLAALGYINIVFALLHLFPGSFQNNKIYQNVLFYSFYLVNIVFLCLNYVDFEYFKFIGRRSTYAFITASGMENELPGLLKSFIMEFWWIPIFMFTTPIVFFVLYRKINYRIKKASFSFAGLITSLVVAAILLVCGRGGLQPKPIRLVDAATYGGLKNSALVLNTPFSVLKTLNKGAGVKQSNYFDKQQLDQIFSPVVSFDYDTIKKKNVVLLIIESMGREHMYTGLTPFLDSLSNNSYFFENGFANGKLSIDAVPSSVSSIPALMDQTYISSSFALNDVYSLPKIFNELGYQTSFFHGAFNGSQNFDQFANVAGFQSYYGKDQYQGPEAFDGTWGIFDEEFMQFASSTMTSYDKPFFATIFTISSHNPYTIPQRYKDKFPKGSYAIDESIAYADYALKEFFAHAKKQPWYDDTLFILTADHTSSGRKEPNWNSNVGKFRIPILFFNPSDPELPVAKVEKNFQQIDILPSVLDYLHIDTKIVTYGKSYLSDQDFVISYLDNIYNYIEADYYLAFDGQNVMGLYNWKQDPALTTNIAQQNPQIAAKMERFLKAYIQSFNYRIQNNLLSDTKN